MQQDKCVVCEAVADVYCVNDEASLCFACDAQVHSANQLASRHNRVPIANAANAASESFNDGLVVPSAFGGQQEPVEHPPVVTNTDETEIPFDDDVLFTVPDISSGVHREAGSGFQAGAVPGKDFLAEDMDLFDLDSCWLDRLDVGLDRLPSDILDSLVPEVPAAASKPVTGKQGPPAQTMVTDPSAHGSPPDSTPQRVLPPTEQMVTYVPAHSMMQTLAFQPQPSQTMPLNSEGNEGPIDISTYVPRSLLPMDPAVRMQLMHGRREKLARFREKKANRHFKKTIRYASRKAYAEVRPRIKGRFARKDEVAAMRAAGTLPV